MRPKCIAFLFTFFFLSTLVVNVASTEPIQRIESIQVSASGIIDREIFVRSIPSHMVVGQTYRAIVVVTNTGNGSANFIVDLVCPYRYTSKYFYSSQFWKPTNLTLDAGVSQRIEFAITPLIEHVGALEIEARIYLAPPLPESEPIYSVSATVREIRTALPIDLLWWTIGFALLVMFLLLAIRLLKRSADRLDLLVALLLFAVAFPLRTLSATISSLHVDESIFWSESYAFLNNNWRWPEESMMRMYPPLFQYLLAGITYLVGSNLMAIRTISIVSGSLSVVVLYFLAKSLFGRKVGLTSALLLCFSSYHILYSGTATTDSLMLLLVLLSVYFFWIGWQRGALKYFVLSGFFLGLAFDVKYVAIFAIPAVILFVVWIRKSFRPLLERRILVWATSFLVTISPVQLTLLEHDINPYYLYLNLAFGPKTALARSFNPVLELIPRGFRIFTYSMARTASPWLPWLGIFEIAICISLFVTVIYHVHLTLKGRPSESFVLIFMLAAISLLVDPVKHNKWLLYSFPFFFAMLSNMVIHYAHDLTARISTARMHAVDLFKIFVVLFVFIFAFSTVVVGTAAPFIDEGEFAGLRSCMSIIKNRVRPNDIIAGTQVKPAIYYINSYDLEVTCISLRTTEDPLLQEGYLELNEQLLRALKPRFIVESRRVFNYYYNVTTKKWVFENYDLPFSSWPPLGYRWIGMEYQEWLVFERKDQ